MLPERLVSNVSFQVLADLRLNMKLSSFLFELFTLRRIMIGNID